MKYTSIGLIFLGLVIALFALNMEVTADDTNIVNLGLLSLRQNYLIVGGILFIAGIILVSKSQRNKSEEKELIINDELSKLKASKQLILSQYLHKKSVGERVMLISFVFALCSLTLDWSIINVDNLDYSHGSKASVRDIITLVVIWFYPIFLMIKNKPIHFYKGVFVGFLSLVWIFRKINNSNVVNIALNGSDSKGITFLNGDGMYVVVAASVLLLIGLIITEWNKSK